MKGNNRESLDDDGREVLVDLFNLCGLGVPEICGARDIELKSCSSQGNQQGWNRDHVEVDLLHEELPQVGRDIGRSHDGPLVVNHPDGNGSARVEYKIVASSDYCGALAK